MDNFVEFLIYLAVMAGVTYLIRMIPLVLVKKKIQNRFVCSFLYYVPYAVLGVMTIPAIFYSTASIASAAAGFVVAVILAYFKKSKYNIRTYFCIFYFCLSYTILHC